MITQRFRNDWARVGLLLLLLTGCAHDGPVVAPVTGTVTLDDEPVDAAGVLFSPVAGGMSASATTDAQGRFELRTGRLDGALLGEHTIVITKSESIGVSGEEGEASGVLAPGWKLVNHLPEKYSDPERSGLTFVVKKGRNECDFQLQSQDAP